MSDVNVVLEDIQAIKDEVVVYLAARDQAVVDSGALAPLQKAVDDAVGALAAAKLVADKSAKSVVDAWALVEAGLAKAEADATASDPPAPAPESPPVVAG